MSRNRGNDIIGLFAIFFIFKQFQEIGNEYYEFVKGLYQSDQVQKYKAHVCVNTSGDILWGIMSFFGVFFMIFGVPLLLISIPILVIISLF